MEEVVGHNLEEEEEEGDQLQVGQEEEEEVEGEVDRHQGEEVAVVPPCCPAKGEEVEGVVVEVLRGLVREEEVEVLRGLVGEEGVEEVVVQKALGLSQPLDLVQ